MRITHVVRQFHPAIGGMENVVENLASAQRAKGHQVRIVTLDRVFNAAKPHRLPAHEWFNGFEIVRVPYFGSKRYPIALSALRHVRDADIVHVHGVDFFLDYLAWTAPFHRRKLVVSTHGGFFHTDKMRVIEKFTRVGDQLTYDVTIEDPDVLLEPWVLPTRQLRRNATNTIVGERGSCTDSEQKEAATQYRH